MMYLRGHHRDFDNWAEITGDPVWKYDSVIEYYKRHENFEEPEEDWEVNTDEFHAQGGELTITKSTFPELAEIFVQAGKEFNMPVRDINARFDEGNKLKYITCLIYCR